MKRFLESIRCFNGQLDNLAHHQERINQVFSAFFPNRAVLSLKDISIPNEYQQGCFKCRLVYSTTLEALQFIPYTIRPINSLQLVNGDECQYDYKFEDRRGIARLYTKRGNADDILIIKNNKITDTSYANVAFFDGQNWLSPVEPLLKGTRRQSLIDQNIIKEKDIYLADLQNYNFLKIFNAMIPFEEATALPITSIRNF